MFPAVGAHNFVINAGVGMSVSTTLPLEYFDSKKYIAQEIQERKANFLGGVVAVDLGYQFLKKSCSTRD